jgi:hypothetical protein
MPAAARVLAAVLLSVLGTVVLVAPATRAVTAPGPEGVWPLAPKPAVVRGFEPPTSTYGTGHRGLDLLGRLAQPVYAALPGRVTFAGQIAGRGVVVVDHGATRTTYEPVVPEVRVGDEVAAGAQVGLLSAALSHCWPRVCLHLGWIRNANDVYLDPMGLFGATAVRLLPLGGLPAPAVALAVRAVALASGAGMGLLIGPPEAVGADVGVELGRRQRGVTEELLHRAQVGASLEQMGRGSVAQPVWADVGSAGHLGDEAMDEGADRALVDAAAPCAEEQCGP